MAFVGQLGYQALAAAAVATTYFNFMAAFMAGMSSAFDTLASQAYGAGDLTMVKVWGVTAAAVLTFVTVPCSVGLWYGESAASFIFGQGPEVASMVGSFCRWLIPGLHSFAMSLVLVKVSIAFTWCCLHVSMLSHSHVSSSSANKVCKDVSRQTCLTRPAFLCNGHQPVW